MTSSRSLFSTAGKALTLNGWIKIRHSINILEKHYRRAKKYKVGSAIDNGDKYVGKK